MSSFSLLCFSGLPLGWTPISVYVCPPVFLETWVPMLSVLEHSIIMNNRYLLALAFMCIHAKLLHHV